MNKIDKQLKLFKKYWPYVLVANILMLLLGGLVISKVVPDSSILSTSASILAMVIAGFDVYMLVQIIRKVVQSITILQNTYLTSRISLLTGAIYNVVYVLLSLFSGYLHQSIWYFIYAVYHLLFAFIKFLIGQRFRERIEKEDWRNYGRVGFFILCSSFIFLSILYFVANGMDQVNVSYPLLVYLIALSTFINMITSISNLFRFRRDPSPRTRSSKQISFTNSLFAVFFLQTMMLKQFGQTDSHESKLLLTYILGAVIFTTLLGQGLFMLKNAKQHLSS